MSLPYRQIHLDFHTSEHIPEVGGAFDPEQFVGCLAAGHVNSVTLFAKCHHGWSYYPTRVGQSHPNLVVPDLLGEQIRACRAANIQTPVYLTVQWDELTAREHPEWRVVCAKHTPFQSPGESPADADLNQLSPQWHPVSVIHEDLVNRLIAQSIEVVEQYDPEGLFLDILLPWQDVSQRNLERMERRGLDPALEKDRLKNDREVIIEYYARFFEALRAVKPGLRIFHNSGHIIKGDRERLGYFTHLELESLPTGGWGYDHFPVSARYVATVGKEFLGMTGKFHTTWGEFGGYKRPVALDYECSQMIAHGARCSIGDQLHPSGKMDADTYRTIAPAYARVEKIEAILPDLLPVAEVGLLSPEAAGYDESRDLAEESGASRMLLESQILFNVLDAEADFADYRLLILPDSIRLDGALSDRLRAFLAGGGKLIASHQSLIQAGAFGLGFPADCEGESPFQPDYLAVGDGWHHDLPASPFVIYEKSLRVRSTGAAVGGEVYDPFFNRSWKHFCSHQHAPARPDPSGYAGILATDAITYFAHPIFRAYAKAGQPLLKYAFQGAISRMLDQPLLQLRGMPSSGRATLSRHGRTGSLYLHLLFAQTQLRGSGLDGWRGRQVMEIIEDTVPCPALQVRLRCDRRPVRVGSLTSGDALEFTWQEGWLEFSTRSFAVHDFIEIACPDR